MNPTGLWDGNSDSLSPPGILAPPLVPRDRGSISQHHKGLPTCICRLPPACASHLQPAPPHSSWSHCDKQVRLECPLAALAAARPWLRCCRQLPQHTKNYNAAARSQDTELLIPSWTAGHFQDRSYRQPARSLPAAKGGCTGQGWAPSAPTKHHAQEGIGEGRLEISPGG